MLLLLTVLPAVLSQCLLDPDSPQWPDWPPILTDQLGEFLLPTLSDSGREISIGSEEVVLLSCAGGEFLQDQSWAAGPLYGRCEGGEDLSVWLEGQDPVTLPFHSLGCSKQPADTNQVVNTCGPQDQATQVEIGFDVKSSQEGIESVTITVCYDTARSVNLWSRHSLWDEINARDHSNDSPSFKPDDYFDFDVNHFYTMVRREAESLQIPASLYLC